MMRLMWYREAVSLFFLLLVYARRADEGRAHAAMPPSNWSLPLTSSAWWTGPRLRYTWRSSLQTANQSRLIALRRSPHLRPESSGSLGLAGAVARVVCLGDVPVKTATTNVAPVRVIITRCAWYRPLELAPEHRHHEPRVKSSLMRMTCRARAVRLGLRLGARCGGGFRHWKPGNCKREIRLHFVTGESGRPFSIG